MYMRMYGTYVVSYDICTTHVHANVWYMLCQRLQHMYHTYTYGCVILMWYPTTHVPHMYMQMRGTCVVSYTTDVHTNVWYIYCILWHIYHTHVHVNVWYMCHRLQHMYHTSMNRFSCNTLEYFDVLPMIYVWWYLLDPKSSLRLILFLLITLVVCILSHTCHSKNATRKTFPVVISTVSPVITVVLAAYPHSLHTYHTQHT
jgi:hypothetical protein